MRPKRIKVFVTGASGKIGQKLLAELTKKYEVYALVRNKDKLKISGANIIEADILEINKYKKIMCDCDVIYHLAAYQNIFDKNFDEFKRVNVDGTRTIIKALASSKIEKFIYISTIMVLEKKSVKNNYVQSKYRATQMVKKSKLPWIIVYPRTVIDKDEISGKGIWKVLSGGIPGGLMLRTGKKERIFKFVWIKDLIKKMVSLVENHSKKREYIIGDEKMSADSYLRYMHKLRKKIYIPWRLSFINRI